MRTAFGAAVMATLVGVGQVQAANLVADPSFETPPVSNTGAGFDLVAPGGTIGPWTVGGAGVVLVGSFGRPSAIDGTQSVELNYYQGGSVEQTVTTTPGTLYTLSFLMAGQTDVGPSVKTMDLYWQGTLAGTFTWDRDLAGGQWQTRSINLLATGTSANLRFLGTVEVDGGPYIDNVNLDVAPEPATLAAIGGLGGLLMRRRPRG